MIIEQIYTSCLAQGAYYIESKGEVAIIDPLREVAQYIERAKENKATIKYIFETHFHADFVSGHLDLSKETGAEIIFGPNATANYQFTNAKDNQVFELGELKIKVIHTPGHTMESSCFLLIDENGKEHSLFSGDTLFIGDVGRPDLAQNSELSMDDLAGHLFDSLRNKIMPLNDNIILYPGHGAGSACGKKMSDETVSTIGQQKKFNYALRSDLSKKDFIAEVTEGLLPPPQYFPKNAKINKDGYENINDIIDKGLNPLTADEFENIANATDAILLDSRNPDEFAIGHIPNSINIGIDDQFAPWVGALITDLEQQILIISENGREEEAITRLSRVGYDNSIGFLEGGFQTWTKSKKDINKIDSVSANEFNKIYSSNSDFTLIDCRTASEFEKSSLDKAINLPLDNINKNMGLYNKDKPMYIFCQTGYRSMINISILKARSFSNIINIKGGFEAITN